MDPWDDLGIWMAHAYAYKNGDKGRLRFAVGKVLGTPQPDLTIEAVKLLEVAKLLPGGALEASFEVANQGDARAPASSVSAELIPSAKPKTKKKPKKSAAARGPIKLATMRTKPLPRGRSRTVRLRLRLPTTVPPGLWRLRIVADAGDRIPEYDGANNRLLSRPFRVSGKR